MSPETQHLYAVILAGGSGTRFWPMSRQRMPKQLLRITSNDRSMFQLTVERAMRLVPAEKIWTVTIEAQGPDIRRELMALGMMDAHLLCEPVGRNTASAIGMAVRCIHEQDPESVVAVFPADHHIEDTERFLQLMMLGKEVASQGWLVTLGIRPKRAETGYGYIQMGPVLEGFPEGEDLPAAHKALRFTEKPDLPTAKSYLKDGSHLWNSGIFIWRADVFLHELSRHLPQHHRTIERIFHRFDTSLPWDDSCRDAYSSLDAISVDFGVMERSERVAIIPADFEWNDVGSWSALWDVLPKDPKGNVLQGEVMAVDTDRCLIRSDERLVASLGLKDIVLVDTPDALLVCSMDRSQEVKKIAQDLLEEGRQEAMVHKEVLKPWGAYRVLCVGEGHQVKWLEVLPSQRLSLQSHSHRTEHWVVVRGEAIVTLDDRTFTLNAGEHAIIPRGSKHRLENRSSFPLRIIEVQVGEYLGEDDIVRYEDDYGRIPSGNTPEV